MGTESSNDEAEFNNYVEQCDRCVARAQERVIKNNLVLSLCRHHFNTHSVKLLADNWVIETAEKKEPVLANG